MFAFLREICYTIDNIYILISQKYMFSKIKIYLLLMFSCFVVSFFTFGETDTYAQNTSDVAR